MLGFLVNKNAILTFGNFRSSGIHKLEPPEPFLAWNLAEFSIITASYYCLK